MRLVFVRHGETDGESSIRYYGATDVPLSEFGRGQMRRAGAALVGERFAAVYASRLARAREGARLVSGRETVMAVAGFNEVNFGAWEGLTEAEIAAHDPACHAVWRQRLAQRADFHYPGGESLAAFRARVIATLQTVLTDAPAGSLLFVLHKGVIRTMLDELLRPDEVGRHDLAVGLASIHVVARVAGQWRAERLDDTAHLALPEAAEWA